MNEKRRSNAGLKIRSFFNSLLTVFIVLLFIVSAFFGGYFLGGNYDILEWFSKLTSNNKKDNTTETTKGTDLDSTLVYSLVSNLVKGSECWTIEEFANDKKVVANDVPSQRAYAVAENNSFYFTGKETITVQEYVAEIQKYFGSKYHFYPELVSYESTACPQYVYNEEQQVFTRQQRDCRIQCGPNTTAYKVVKANENNGKLTITIKVLFGSKEGTNFYADYDKTKLITNNPNEVKSALSQGTEYIFTFEKEDGNYVFLSSEPSK